MKVQTLLDLIDSGDIALPEFQRGYVWNREQVRGFFTSLYRGYPVGSFIAKPELSVEVTDGSTGEVLCTAEAFWPLGLQEGLGMPVVLELDEPRATPGLEACGYLVFTSPDALRAYVERQRASA